jgi:glutamyl-tRNA synthetase
MPASRLVDLLIPYWQEAGFDFNPEEARPWLERLAAVIGPSLTRLPEAVDMTRMFFTESVEYTQDAIKQLQKEGATAVVQGILDALKNTEQFDTDKAQQLIKTVTKEKNVKKGLVMRSLRAALTGDVHGPDLMESWLLLNQQGKDEIRLRDALAQVS